MSGAAITITVAGTEIVDVATHIAQIVAAADVARVAERRVRQAEAGLSVDSQRGFER